MKREVMVFHSPGQPKTFLVPIWLSLPETAALRAFADAFFPDKYEVF